MQQSRFNPRACEGATIILGLVHLICVVSIHAPVKARPLPVDHPEHPNDVSIHAPVKARQFSKLAGDWEALFQSTRL